jgi:hypothetical protein
MQAMPRFLSTLSRAVAALALGATLALPVPLSAQPLRLAQAPASPATALESLAIVSGGKRHVFQVEVMRTPEQRARGLMHRRYLPADRGMLFDFGRTEPVAMWMENTYIPLDMLFIRADGTIARIAENTEPLSQRTIPSGEPVLSVLEINGGVSRTLGLKPGDRVEHALFKR